MFKDAVPHFVTQLYIEPQYHLREFISIKSDVIVLVAQDRCVFCIIQRCGQSTTDNYTEDNNCCVFHFDFWLINNIDFKTRCLAINCVFRTDVFQIVFGLFIYKSKICSPSKGEWMLRKFTYRYSEVIVFKTFWMRTNCVGGGGGGGGSHLTRREHTPSQAECKLHYISTAGVHARLCTMRL